MAEAPRDIQSILAALAAQRPPASAPPPGPPGVPPSYPPPGQAAPSYPLPAQPPSYAPPPGAYGLPQPASSGSLDLSSVRPINSGTVSLDDAIAKAKAYAADRGIAPVEGGAAYGIRDARGGRRSRSRSPMRRDHYRDNYNPYREERREERSGQYREYGREQEYSPGPRGRPSGAFSPRSAGGAGGVAASGRDRSPARGGDDNSEVIQIESSLVGLIIGRQGENLRRIESESGCRVQFLAATDNGPFRQCKITGPRARRAEVKTAINRIIEDSGMGAVNRGMTHDKGRDPRVTVTAGAREGEDCMQIMVPDRTVGLIIGRGGETIRDLQERSGCHINIVGESKSVNGLRPVNLIGTREAAAQAKDLILEIVDSDSRNEGPAARKAAGGKPEPAAQRDGGHGGPDKVQDAIFVPSEAVGMIIGKGGETIREMQNSTGCKINVAQSSGPGEVQREIALIGSRDAINRAKRAIEDKVDAVRQKSGSGGGGGGGGSRGRTRDFDQGSNFSQQVANPAGQSAAQPPAAADGSDPYAQYGGYQNYVALWYSAIQSGYQQQPGAAAPGAPAPGQ